LSSGSSHSISAPCEWTIDGGRFGKTIADFQKKRGPSLSATAGVARILLPPHRALKKKRRRRQFQERETDECLQLFGGKSRASDPEQVDARVRKKSRGAVEVMKKEHGRRGRILGEREGAASPTDQRGKGGAWAFWQNTLEEGSCH